MMSEKKIRILAESFRDPSGFLFRHDSILYRLVNDTYKEHYDALMTTGLYQELVEKKLLVPHQEVDPDFEIPNTAYKVIRPQNISFISYPYEWSFGQLKNAALATLEIERIALKYGVTLKDASAYNIQFIDGKPVLIDTLSFEKYRLGDPWIAYRQYCQHFLAPLMLMAYCDVRLGQLLKIYIDGVPLDLASSLLPKRSWANFGAITHIHLHAKSQKKHAAAYLPMQRPNMGQSALFGLIDNLSTTVSRLNWRPDGTEWADYYNDNNYAQSEFENKKKLIQDYLDLTKPFSVWDLGANVGLFSRLASQEGIFTVAFDIDPACVERNYLNVVKHDESCLLPLVLDLTNPSPGIGWANKERSTLIDRGPADMVFALALLHHLAISNNLPFNLIAGFFSRICNNLIIEYVPKKDSQVQRMLVNREDIFNEYTQEIFEMEFGQYFVTIRKDTVTNSSRTLYLMKRHT
jgi:hypothetical protein